MARQKEYDAHDGELGKGKDLELGEIGDPGPVEMTAQADLKDLELEAFMNEMLIVRVHEDSNDNSVEVPCPNVNGLNQPFIRGQDQKVKRKYVEALARCRVTKYEQQQDMNRPDNIKMVERTALAYPFTVMHDPNPRGRAWLDAILKQR